MPQPKNSIDILNVRENWNVSLANLHKDSATATVRLSTSELFVFTFHSLPILLFFTGRNQCFKPDYRRSLQK
jgi:hypothetical protein